MNTRTLAKTRAARRAREGGGVIFIVAMTLAVLGALGAYALQSASMEIKTAGFERQNTQTHYLAEYGILGAMQNVTPTTAQLYLQLMVNQAATACTSLPGTSYVSPNKLSRACIRMDAAQMQKAWPAAVANSTIPLNAWGGSPTTPGSLGIVPVTGNFYAELSEPVQAPMIAGFDLNSGFCPIQFTVSSYGMTQPSNTGSNTTAMYAGQGMETARARVVGGPVSWSGCAGK
jgi:hypothetical protein